MSEARISRSQVKKLDGFNKHAERIRAFLIGQLGKNDNVAHNPLCLHNILDEIYLVIHEARELIGGRVVILECENNEHLISLYKSHGFKLIETDLDSQDKMQTMYIYIEKS